jgi:hypothetical protein
MSLQKHLISRLLLESRAKQFISQGWNPEYVKLAFDNFKKADIAEYVLKVLTYGEALNKDKELQSLVFDKQNTTGFDEKTVKLAKKILKTFDENELESLLYEYSRLKNQSGKLWENLKHYLSFQNYIQTYPIKLTSSENKLLSPSVIIDSLDSWENERIDRQKEKTKELDTGEPILEFKDGWYWAFIDEPSCSAEGKAMGHCGNTANPDPNDTIFSLRTPNGSPRATFIVNDGVVGEMKGRFNKKPEDELHPYIIELLKSDHVQHIKGGGYAPQNNFDLYDLTNDQREDILNLKPDIMLNLDTVFALWEKGEERRAKNLFYDLTDARLDSIKDGELIEDTTTLSRFLSDYDWADGVDFLYGLHSVLEEITSAKTLLVDINKELIDDEEEEEDLGESDDEQSFKYLLVFSRYLMKTKNFDLIERIVNFLKDNDSSLNLNAVKEYEIDEIVQTNELSRGVRKLEKTVYSAIKKRLRTASTSTEVYFNNINVKDLKEVFIKMCDVVINQLPNRFRTAVFNENLTDFLSTDDFNETTPLIDIIYDVYMINEAIDEGYTYDITNTDDNNTDIDNLMRYPDEFISKISDSNVYKEKISENSTNMKYYIDTNDGHLAFLYDILSENKSKQDNMSNIQEILDETVDILDKLF